MNQHPTQDLTVGAQPTTQEISQLAREGFKTVINLRVENEQEGQLSPMEEGQTVRDAGMEYLHIPVIGNQIREGQVDEFTNAVESLPKPIYVHCAKGKRAGLFSTMHCAVKDGLSGKQTLARAKETGIEIDDANLERFVKEYVESRVK
jgi:uncharacterized protein (TIGR01244 family)